MMIPDANVLLYAVNTASQKHEEAVTWLDGALNDGHVVGFSWIVLLAFLRLSTKVGLFPTPLPVADANARIAEWLSQPTSIVVEPTSRHQAVLSGLLQEVGSGGNLVNDAHLGALAVEHGAAVISYDSDFARFTGIRWMSPGKALSR